jgi:DNA-binding response OmpR family regulator
MRIAILDDELDMLEFVFQALVDAGHQCYKFSTVRAFSARLRIDTFDLVVLDWNMPDKSGLEVIAWLKANIDPPPPVVLLTNRTADEDIVVGLDAGADDYVVKPVNPTILQARVNALLRRMTPREAPGGIETYGLFMLQPARQSVTVDGEEIVLTAKEFDLTSTLFRNLHRPLSRSYLLETVWGRNPDLPTRTLDAHISKIRSKIGLRPDRGFRLVPVYSYGYRLEPVQPGDGEAV